MIEFVNKRSGLIFLVADERKDFYLEAGHKLASEVLAQKPSEEPTKRKKSTRTKRS